MRLTIQCNGSELRAGADIVQGRSPVPYRETRDLDYVAILHVNRIYGVKYLPATGEVEYDIDGDHRVIVVKIEEAQR